MAVYTHLTEGDVAGLLAAYDLGALERLEGISGGVGNTNYHVFTDRGRAILTLFETERGAQTRAAEIPFFLDLMDHLAAGGVPCPRALRARDGTNIQTLAGRPAVLVSFAQGRHVLGGDITPAHCAEVGRVLARMHLAAEGFPGHRPNHGGARHWAGQAQALRAELEGFRPGLEALVDDELAHIARHWPQDLPTGVVHADVFPDNVLFDGARLAAVIDFELAGRDFYAYDLATALNTWCFPEGPAQSALMAAYEAQRPLSGAERAALPVLRRGAALRWALARLKNWVAETGDAVITPHDPGEYIDKLAHLRGAQG